MPTVEVIARGDSMEMGLAQGERLREKIRLAPGILEKLDGFRMLQPAWMPYGLYRRLAERRAARTIETSLARDFSKAHRRMQGIAAGSGTTMPFLQLLH